jgi:hypothetical protein
MTKPFPKELYVVEEDDGEDGFLSCNDDPRELAQVNEARHAAKYVKVENVIISNQTEVSK